MGLNSMTGFARAQGECDGISWYWELRSVNGRGLDVRTRLGPGQDSLDAKVRGAVGKVLRRGNVNVALNVSRLESVAELQINADALAQVITAANKVRDMVGDCEPMRPEGLLALKGVLETRVREEADEVVSSRQARMMETFEAALNGLVEARAQEGAGLERIVTDQLDEIERLVGAVTKSDARQPDVIRARLKEQIGRIMDSGHDFDEGRLHQEAVLLATRFDVEEELQRLIQHIIAGRALLGSEDAVGRKLDFLAQEFNREANTLCSKSNDGAVSQAGMALKVVIDQMREQVQNIE